MAKYAELTGVREGERLLLNPDHVVGFEGASIRDPEGALTKIILTVGGPLFVVEDPAEVLARLCSPVMPDGSEAAELSEIVADIAKLRAWSEASDEHDPSGSYEELGKVWELLDDIEARLKALA
jgi:hypothetical protein